MEKKEVVAGQSFISPFRPTTTSSLLRSALCSTYLFAMPCLSKWYFLSMPTHLLMSNAHSLTYEQCSLLSDVQCKARICSIPGTLTNPSIQVVWLVLIYPPRSTYCATRKSSTRHFFQSVKESVSRPAILSITNSWNSHLPINKSVYLKVSPTCLC
jgi:hypothetical protein